MVWLSQVSGEPHRLADGSRAFVYIHLLSVSGPASKVAAEWLPIDKEITGNNTDVLPLSEDIETGGLPGARGTHEGGHRSGLDVTVNVVEELTGSTGDGHSITDVFPSKGLVVSEGNLLLGLGLLLFDALGSLLLLPESLIEFSSLLGLLSEDGEANATERRSLETPFD